MNETKVELNLENVLALLTSSPVKESRGDEFYAVGQLLVEWELDADEQHKLGETIMKMLETDEWWRSNGAFRDD